MAAVTTQDGTEIYYKDWGTGRPVVLSHGWPLNADSWESQAAALAAHGYRVVAHDRRGHGRSSQPWDGNDMDTFADDLSTLIDHLDLHDVTLVGFSMGGGEVTRYIGRHGTFRVAQVALVSAVPPFMLRTDDNPEGLPIEVFDGIRTSLVNDRAQAYREFADGPFFGANRPGSNVSQGARDSFWAQGMLSSLRSSYECVAAFSATDFRPDLAAFDVPTLVIHGDDDQVVPFEVGGKRSAELIKDATLKVYEGGPHGLPATHRERLSTDLLEFVSSTRA
ncbi:chloroperoxidase [Frankia sp. R43]|uniref:alpha/beta fold hydrolase n=1 Tax=Frankia sp. R43 TaxID=269536 RepID=UPI0006CA11D8|nr:alpha/beta hydrolase [Frankia sp. R43]KPM55347.1 chloroperoxidase [Frankia sp. R43]